MCKIKIGNVGYYFFKVIQNRVEIVMVMVYYMVIEYFVSYWMSYLFVNVSFNCCLIFEGEYDVVEFQVQWGQ